MNQPDDWIDILQQLRTTGTPCVLLTVLNEKGSVPRGDGTKMVVAAGETWLTIGGGNLEFQCIAQARTMLQAQQTMPHLEHIALGARTGQCCGGMASVLFEPLLSPRPSVVVFGAGHVGQALVNLLSTLPCQVTWVDERPGMFAAAPSGVICRQADDPNDEVRCAAPGSYFVVMTHHHPRDLALAETILRRDDYRYFGLIGSRTKRQRFDYRLEGKGIAAQQLAKMRCPVGLPDVKGKLPAEIAVSIAGELIAVWQQDA